MTMRVLYVGPFGSPSGYGVAATGYCAALHKAGVHLRIQPAIPDPKPAKRYRHLKGFIGPGKERPTHVVVHAVPRAAAEIGAQLPFPSNVRRIAVTTWETTHLSRDIASELNRYDLVIVPSIWNAEVLRRAGVRRVEPLVHSIDLDWWLSGSIPMEDRPFTFVSTLTWCERKNPIGLLTAYLTAFRSTDNVLLKICTPSWSKLEVTQLVQRMGLTDLPQVEFVSRLSDEAYREFIATADCYVSASRSEGFGLGAFEATMLGKPVIHPGPLVGDFLPRGGPSMVTSFMTPAFVPFTASDTQFDLGGGRKLRPVLQNTHDSVTVEGDWMEPNLEMLSTLMRHATDIGRPTLIPPVQTADYSEGSVGGAFRGLLEVL